MENLPLQFQPGAILPSMEQHPFLEPIRGVHYDLINGLEKTLTPSVQISDFQETVRHLLASKRPAETSGVSNLLEDSPRFIVNETTPKKPKSESPSQRRSTSPKLKLPIDKFLGSFPMTIHYLAKATLNSKFELSAQPKPFQRKSYRGENRWLLPSPLVVNSKIAKDAIYGFASVNLVEDATGLILPEGFLVGSGAQELTTDRISFSLQTVNINTRTSYRLLFQIRSSDSKGGSETVDFVLSSPFTMISHTSTKKNLILQDKSGSL